MTPASKKNKIAGKTSARFKKPERDVGLLLNEFIKFIFRQGLRAEKSFSQLKSFRKNLPVYRRAARQDCVCNLLALFLKVKIFNDE
jgi:hypothetical protein